MSRATVEQAIELAMASGNVPNLIGDTGVGKSDMIERIAKRTNRKLILLNLGTQEPSDLIGMPSSRNGRTHWDLPCWWPTPEDNHCIIFIDEINRAKKDVINAIFPMILSKTLHVEHTLPSDTWICSAMNPDTEDFGLVFSFDDAAFTARFVHIAIEGDFTTWKQWMETEKGGEYEQYFSLMERNSNQLLPDSKPTTINFDIKPKWRSWTKFIDVVEHCKKCDITDAENALIIIAKGMLGNKAASILAVHIESLLLGSGTDALKTLLATSVNNDNVVGVAETFMSLAASGAIKPTEELIDWICKLGEHHPAVMRKIISSTSSQLMDQLYAFPKYVNMISYVSMN